MKKSEAVFRDTAHLVKDGRAKTLDANMPPDRESTRDDPKSVFGSRRPRRIIAPPTFDVTAKQPRAAQSRASEKRQITGTQSILEVEGKAIGRWMLLGFGPAIVKDRRERELG